MSRTVEDRLLSRARKAYAHAAAARTEAAAVEASARVQRRLNKAARGQRQRYVEALYLAELDA